MTSEIVADLHVAFVHRLDETVLWKAQHLKMSGVYWGIGALQLLGRCDYARQDVLDFVMTCYNEDGGFGGNADHDSHVLYTLSALQLLCIYDALDLIDVDRTAAWIAGMQQQDGCFQGDKWGEVDTRFVYIGLSALQLLGRLHLANVEKAVEWVLQCENWDGGFGVLPGAESHAGQIFCCVGALCIANALDRIDVNRLSAWLAMRQLPSGGLNGRPEKKGGRLLQLVDYFGALRDAANHVDRQGGVVKYILSCQDKEDGGIADKPGNEADVYHTFFGLCGLSLLGYEGYPLQKVNPVYALPYEVLERLGVPPERGLNAGR
ncbi:geranylgeranyl transferase type-2 subunit beta [Strigomonas culicis]|uniref:Geranylgeranyl transferase type-2 subunit beta n=1 Tax=Strigomonas culicis TaxID=28005 RepID=S9VAY4_9TRYP|nr:geranylgeranyl transferase type-2 subunit beta [Strigomonas culicis]|eukprot:EPY20240.1 geranylgeranyl transferase type-2 subunit beta [Strigomonas culicis]